MEVGGGWWCFSRALSQPVGDPEFISTIKTSFRRPRIRLSRPPESSLLHTQTSYRTEHTLDTLLGTPVFFRDQIQHLLEMFLHVDMTSSRYHHTAAASMMGICRPSTSQSCSEICDSGALFRDALLQTFLVKHTYLTSCFLLIVSSDLSYHFLPASCCFLNSVVVKIAARPESLTPPFFIVLMLSARLVFSLNAATAK